MLLLAALCLCLAVAPSAQSVKTIPASALIGSYKLEVACNKTTHLLFPFSIISVDRGSESILAQKANGVENILRVKGGVKNFEQTSLSVITSDGKLYSFLIDFSPMPAYLNINLGSIASVGKQEPSSACFEPAPAISNEVTLASLVQAAQKAKRNIYRLRKEKQGVSAEVDGLYIKDDMMLFRLQLENSSVINYSIDQFRVYMRDKKGGKRTAVQEQELQPLHRAGDTALIPHHSGHPVVLALPKFTIPDGKFIAVEITEQNGGRNLQLKIKNRHLLKTKLLR